MTETMMLKVSSFETLSADEMLAVDGGSVGTAIGWTVAVVAVAWAAPVGLITGSAYAAGALVLTGAGLVGKLTGWY